MKSIAKIASAKPSVLFPVISPEFVLRTPPRPPSRARTARETLTSIDAPLDARSTSSARVDAPESPSEAEPSSVATARVGPRARTTRRARAETLKLSGFQPREGFEAGGDVVKWGDKFLKDSAEACHDACVEMRDEGCTVFVWCGFESGCLGQPHKSCWLKKQARATMTTGTEGGGNPWTSGSIYVQDDMRGDPDPSRKFHVVMTTNNAVLGSLSTGTRPSRCRSASCPVSCTPLSLRSCA